MFSNFNAQKTARNVTYHNPDQNCLLDKCFVKILCEKVKATPLCTLLSKQSIDPNL